MAALYRITPRPPHRLRRLRARRTPSSSPFAARAPPGSPGESDVFGSQHYAPLFEIEVP
ncbi:MAG: hypothetical protein RML45_01670 [Acetobacteraceae bacterium]|nr:hypothetical protein [Acetobacteraceae bacterium]